MAMEPHLNNQSGNWTNEKHVHFLNSMEAYFVRTMLESNGRLLRLDRYLPDTSESTLDLKSQRSKKHASSSDIVGVGPRTRREGRPDKRTRRLSSQHFDPSQQQDQVVPQFENRSGDKDERDPPAIAGATMAPAN